MSELKMGIAQSDEWYTPKFIFDALGVTFDLDPCGAGRNGEDFVPTRYRYVMQDDGLKQPWHGFIWMNPPFGGRNGQVPWLKRFFEHGDGIALVRAYTSSAWFHQFAPKASGMLFPRGKTKFIRPDGTEGKSPSSGVVLLAAGFRAAGILRNSGLGIYLAEPPRPENGGGE